MNRPVAGFIGLRYLRSQRSNQFASFVTMASAIGVGLGESFPRPGSLHHAEMR